MGPAATVILFSLAATALLLFPALSLLSVGGMVLIITNMQVWLPSFMHPKWEGKGLEAPGGKKVRESLWGWLKSSSPLQWFPFSCLQPTFCELLKTELGGTAILTVYHQSKPVYSRKAILDGKRSGRIFIWGWRSGLHSCFDFLIVSSPPQLSFCERL